VVACLAIGPWVIGFLGQKAWDRTRTELLARGEKLSLADFIPPSIPDSRNFFADPMWQEIVEHQIPGENGKSAWGPTVPKEKAQFYVLHKSLSATELKSIQEKFPGILTARDRVNLADILTTKARESEDSSLKTAAASAVLETLEPARPIIARVHELLDRPAARFPIAYERGIFASFPQASEISALSSALSSRAQAAFILRDRQAAFRDTFDLLRLAGILENGPTLLGFLTPINTTNLACRNICEGISLHVWQEQELVTFQNTLGHLRFFSPLARALRGERGMGNTVFENVQQPPLNQYPLKLFKGFDQAFYNRTIQQTLDALGTGPAFDPLPIERLQEEVYRDEEGWRSYLSFLSNLLVPEFRSAICAAARSQDQVIMAGIACALERYRLKIGAYPTALAELVPGYLSNIPVDLIAGHPFRYHLENSGQFQLWSIGWDGIDDHGIPNKERQMGDWPWNPPPPSLHR